MKKGLLIVLLLSAGFAQAQSLKDALFSGKLKNDPGTVIRKDDDLSTKIDTAQKAAPTETAVTTASAEINDSSAKQPAPSANSAALSTTNPTNETTGATGSTTAAASPTTAAPKSNNAVWKQYMDTLASTLKTEALPSKKIKRGSYFVLVTYTIATDGQTSVTDVSVSPDNAFLQQQIKDRLMSDTPHLSPVLSDSGAPRKVIRKASFTLNKE